MQTVTVRTTGDFMLIDRHSGKEIAHDRDTPDVPLTEFIRERLTNGDLELVEALTEPEPEPEPEPAADADGDGHDDKTGEFVEGNKVATKRGRR